MKILPLGFWALSTIGETTSFLIDGKCFYLLLDSGLNPSLPLTKAGYKLTQISYLFISHSHSDHLQGFANFLFTRTVQERKFGKAPILNVFANEINIKNCKNLLKIFYPERDFDVNWIIVKEGMEFDINNGYKIKFFKTDHTVKSLGACLQYGSKKIISYTSDTILNNKLIESCKDSKLVLGECFGTKSDFGPILNKLKHMSAEDVGELAHKANIKKLVIFHMQGIYKKKKKSSQLIQIIEQKFKGEIIFPRELEPIEV